MTSQDALVLAQGLPLGPAPVDVLVVALTGAGLPTQQHHDQVGLDRNKVKEETVVAAATGTLQSCLPQEPILVHFALTR